MSKTATGFTLIEMMYALAIAGLLVTVGIPAFTTTIQNGAMTASTNSIITALLAARSEAVKTRARVTVCPARLVGANPACAGGGDSLLVFVNADDDATFDAGSGDIIVQFQEWTRGDVTTATDDLPGYVTYQPSGFTRAIGGGPIIGDLVFCDGRGDKAARVMSISATGRPQMRSHDQVANAPSCES